MKITYSTDNINSFGGINFADHIIGNASFYELIDQELGAKYSYSDLIRTYLLLTLCGGECAEDVTENLRSELKQVKSFSPSSADTLLRMQKELATDKETFLSTSGIEHDFNINLSMNRLMLKLLIKSGQLDSN